MKRAICLSGGGAKGAYQIGVFKGLKRLGIKYDIVTGTSVGALNGILFVQNDLFKGLKLWKKMNFNIVFNDDILKEFNNLKTTKDIIKMYSSNYFKNGGLETENLEKHAEKILNPNKFFKSKVNFSISTYNLTKNKLEKIQKKDMTEDNIINYVLASSSCYPAIKKRKINTDEYIDGGISDNLPINSAIDMGATEIIAVDLKAPGIKETIKDKTIKIIYIKPKKHIGNFLNFNKRDARRAIKFGYFDTLKTYNKLDGNYYTFKKNHLTKNDNKYSQKLSVNLTKILKEPNNSIDHFKKNITLKRFIKIGKENFIISEMVEYIGKSFKIEDCKCYRIKKYNKILLKKLHQIEITEEIELTNKFSFLNIFNKGKMIKQIYLMIKNNKNENNNKELSNIALTLPKEFLSALYLYTIEKR